MSKRKNKTSKKWYWIGGITATIIMVVGLFALTDNHNDFPVARVGSVEVFASDVLVNLAQAEHTLMWDYFDMFPEDWDIDHDREFRDGLTFGQAVQEEALRLATLNIFTLDYANQLGISLSSDDLLRVDEYLDNLIWQFGGERELNEVLRAEGFRDIAHLAELYANQILLDNIILAITSNPDDFARFEQYMPPEPEPVELFGAKHILASFDNFENEAEAREFASDILAKLHTGEDFTTLMWEYSQDNGLWDFPDGYSFASGDMVLEFEQATKELEMGEISGLVESNFGIHIIMRTETNEGDWHFLRGTQPVTLESRMMDAVFFGIEAMAENVAVELLQEFNKISVH